MPHFVAAGEVIDGADEAWHAACIGSQDNQQDEEQEEQGREPAHLAVSLLHNAGREPGPAFAAVTRLPQCGLAAVCIGGEGPAFKGADKVELRYTLSGCSVDIENQVRFQHLPAAGTIVCDAQVSPTGHKG